MPLIKVRALERGYYDKTPGHEIIRNEGEVFDMDTEHMHKPGRPGDGMNTVITVKLGKGPTGKSEDFVLPHWVESAEDSGTKITKDAETPKGHSTVFDKSNINVI